MAGNLQPLDKNIQLVKPDGRPTDFFIRWAQQRQMDIQNGITVGQLEEFLAAHTLQAGSGIGLAPSGNIADSPTITAKVQEILDQISTTWGSVLFRGTALWQALGPGTAGHFLKTNGAGADPAWAAATGTGAMVLIESYAGTGSTGTKTFSSIPSTYTDLVLTIFGRTSAAVGNAAVTIQVNSLSTAIYDLQRQYALNTTNGADQTLGGTSFANAIALGGTSLAAGDIAGSEVVLQGYAGTTFNKLIHGRSRFPSSNTTHDGYVLHFSGQVRLTSAINSITLALTSGNFVVGSLINLYGRT